MILSMVQNALSLINIILGGLIVVYQLRAYRVCNPKLKWLYALKASAGAALALLFLDVLFRSLSGGIDTIAPIIGRPVLSLVESALVFDAVVNSKIQGEC